MSFNSPAEFDCAVKRAVHVAGGTPAKATVRL